MKRKERPVSKNQIPEEARIYLAAIEPHRKHPFVQQHFHQVTWLSFGAPGHRNVEFFALEFRSGKRAALIWQDGKGNWGAGRWLALSRAPMPKSRARHHRYLYHTSKVRRLIRR